MDIEMIFGSPILLAGVVGGFLWAHHDNKKRDRQ
jgi:hypothetical protein